uniref:Uncharacterized protein n=1 Tax=Ixodes ricinus TaxID=34613 RepID=A0A147BIV3_IXORI
MPVLVFSSSLMVIHLLFFHIFFLFAYFSYRVFPVFKFSRLWVGRVGDSGKKQQHKKDQKKRGDAQKVPFLSFCMRPMLSWSFLLCCSCNQIFDFVFLFTFWHFFFSLYVLSSLMPLLYL